MTTPTLFQQGTAGERNLHIDRFGTAEEFNLGYDSVTQATSITTGVTLNAKAGLITTQSASTAADASSTFTVTCNRATASSAILVSIVNYAGTFSTNGIPVVNVDNRTAGTFDIVVSNAHSANALSGALVIAYRIL